MKAQVHAARVHARCLLLGGLCALMLWTVPAMAFFPMGKYNASNQIRYVTWSKTALHDRNNDGDISGVDEGVQVIIESGTDGFTDQEIETIRDAFKVWQYLPTTFVGFDTRETSAEPLIPAGPTGKDDRVGAKAGEGEGEGEGETGGEGEGEGETGGVTVEPGDLLNSVIMTSSLPTGVLGATTLLFSPDDAQISGGGISVYVSGGQIIEADIVISSAMVRSASPGLEPVSDLYAVMVHEIGHFIGIDHTPLNNLEIVGSKLLENRVFAQRDAYGVLQVVGATPTMFPVVFDTDDGNGDTYVGQGDLAPDDIAAASFLYPRGSQERFFSVQQEARTRVSQPSFPTVPIGSVHVVAWCDVDNDPNTPRIPLFSTITGLYEQEAARCGFFDLKGLLKTIETVGGASPVQATYTLTACPLSGAGLEKQAPPTYGPAYFTSITPSAATTNVLLTFPTETFYDGTKVYDMALHDVGTPLLYDRFSNQVVSATTGKTLATMLPYHTPMFGERNDVCPLLVTVGALGDSSAKLPGALRSLRDNVLLKSWIGTAIVDGYYRLAPSVARRLYVEPQLVKGAAMILSVIEWGLRHVVLAGAGLVALLASACWFLRAKLRPLHIAGLVVATAFLGAQPADALIANMSDADMIDASSAVVTGDVQSVQSHYVRQGNHNTIVTDVTIKVSDTVVGDMPKASTLVLTIPGGQVGKLVLLVTDMPKFREGEETLLFLEDRAKAGMLVVAGSRGKFEISTDKATGEKSVKASSTEAQTALTKSAAKVNGNAKEAQTTASGVVPLDQYKDYLKGLAKKKAAK